MNKNLSLVSMIAMVLFMSATYSTSQSQSALAAADQFGFPFVFFTAANNGEVISETHFNLLSLIGDLSIYFALAFGFVAILSILKVEKKKASIA
jgi:hypothetical protein